MWSPVTCAGWATHITMTTPFFYQVLLPNFMTEPPDDVIDIVSVTSLTLDVEGGSDVDEVMDQLLNVLELPNVVDLTLRLHLDGSFTIRISILDHRSPDAAILEPILHQCPSLVELALEIPGLDLFGSSHTPEIELDDLWFRHLPLQILRLINCDTVTTADADTLIGKLRVGPTWNTFLMLEISGCKRLSEGFFLAIEDEMESKLRWSMAT
ncbi:hypothetical protein BD410DRAFT_434039 [Rickenella mellea]|uniref:F-box domain-containing protein n=1 Tax=Rickenella mellea TaxID=50990 RepID=A0A4Y7PX62_9AGAM|nr:hypothetical protein BD410DRAFT_434039 [Rickenella mellea]